MCVDAQVLLLADICEWRRCCQLHTAVVHALLRIVYRVITQVTSQVSSWLVNHCEAVLLDVRDVYAERYTGRGGGVETKMLRKLEQG